MRYLLLPLLLVQLPIAYALVRAGLRRAPYRWAAWLVLLLWVEAAVFIDKLVAQGA